MNVREIRNEMLRMAKNSHKVNELHAIFANAKLAGYTTVTIMCHADEWEVYGLEGVTAKCLGSVIVADVGEVTMSVSVIKWADALATRIAKASIDDLAKATRVCREDINAEVHDLLVDYVRGDDYITLYAGIMEVIDKVAGK